ncbi:hypothetical protein AL522_22545 (plasmid) [Pantoea vagans]|nr:hypothetical protein AL522_22545 [Pantoea vagans]
MLTFTVISKVLSGNQQKEALFCLNQNVHCNQQSRSWKALIDEYVSTHLLLKPYGKARQEKRGRGHNSKTCLVY